MGALVRLGESVSELCRGAIPTNVAFRPMEITAADAAAGGPAPQRMVRPDVIDINTNWNMNLYDLGPLSGTVP